jgi:hypothetical protein
MTLDSSDSAEQLMNDIRTLHTSAWAKAAAPASREEAHHRILLDAMRKISVGMLHYGVTTAVIEGAYLLWWMRFARINHGFPDEDWKRMARLLGPISDIFRRLADEIEDDGPMPELQLLGEKVEELRALAGGTVATWPKSKQAEEEQTELAHKFIRTVLVTSIDNRVSPHLIESMLLYFWFRFTVNRCGLEEEFFQKLERNWEVVMEHVNRYMDEQAAADRRNG